MQTAEQLKEKLAAIERQLEALTAEVARNEAKHKRSQKREMRLLQAEDLGGLFRELTSGLRDSYGLEHVSVVICDPGHDLRHLLHATGSPAEGIEHLQVVESTMGLAPQYVALRYPWLGRFAACDHQLIFPGASGVESVAMIPLRQRGELIGSINLGSRDAERFTRKHASDFLAQLGVIASYCIENVVNRARLLRSGFTDVLTGWHNRRYLQVRMHEELARASRDRSNLACLMLDVDHFKSVNDTWGHAAGDAVLREIAQRIDAEVRASDIAARYGGEEFVVLLPYTETKDAEHLAERIRAAIAASKFTLVSGESVEITVSIGIAGIVPDPQVKDLKTLGESLMARADVALYKAKSDGRDCVVVGAAA